VEWADEMYFKSWVEMDVDIRAAGGVTVIVSYEASHLRISYLISGRAHLATSVISKSQVLGFALKGT
jgi:hypothetical protein